MNTHGTKSNFKISRFALAVTLVAFFAAILLKIGRQFGGKD